MDNCIMNLQIRKILQFKLCEIPLRYFRRRAVNLVLVLYLLWHLRYCDALTCKHQYDAMRAGFKTLYVPLSAVATNWFVVKWNETLPFCLKIHNAIKEALLPDGCCEPKPTWPACSWTVGGVQSTWKEPTQIEWENVAKVVWCWGLIERPQQYVSLSFL